jgi:hypothetical protein
MNITGERIALFTEIINISMIPICSSILCSSDHLKKGTVLKYLIKQYNFKQITESLGSRNSSVII